MHIYIVYQKGISWKGKFSIHILSLRKSILCNIIDIQRFEHNRKYFIHNSFGHTHIIIIIFVFVHTKLAYVKRMIF